MLHKSDRNKQKWEGNDTNARANFVVSNYLLSLFLINTLCIVYELFYQVFFELSMRCIHLYRYWESTQIYICSHHHIITSISCSIPLIISSIWKSLIDDHFHISHLNIFNIGQSSCWHLSNLLNTIELIWFHPND